LAGIILILSFSSEFDVIDDDEGDRAGSKRGVIALMILGLFLFSTTLTEEPLAQNLPTGSSTMGFGSDFAHYWHIMSGGLAFVAMLCGNCAELSARKIIGFSTVFGVVGYLALIDFQDHNANFAGFFTSVSVLSFALPLGKFASLAALRELTG
jgi:hypothetical protein